MSSHVLHEIERMTSNILLLHAGRIRAEGDVHQIRDLIDECPHTVRITASDPWSLPWSVSDGMARLGLEARMMIQESARRGVSGRQIAPPLEVTEGTVRHHRHRPRPAPHPGPGPA